MTTAEPKQRAEVRVALHDDGEYLLLLDARVQGWDVYAGSGKGLGKKQRKFRLSWHESGETRRHILGAPSEKGRRMEKPEHFEGIVNLSSFALLSSEWDYKPKGDSNDRRTLIVDVADTKGRGCSADIWVCGGQGIENSVKEILADYQAQGSEVLGHVVVDWTQPQLVGVAWIVSDSIAQSLYESLVREYSVKIQDDPNDAKAYADRGIAYCGLGEYQLANEDFDTSVRLNPEPSKRLLDYWHTANVSLAVSHMEKEEWADSIPYLHKMVKLKPEKSLGWADRGLAYLMERRLDEALEDFNEAIRRDPNLAKALYNRACLYSLREDVDPCASDLEKSIALEPARREKAKNDPDLKWARAQPTVKTILGLK